MLLSFHELDHQAKDYLVTEDTNPNHMYQPLSSRWFKMGSPGFDAKTFVI